MRSSVSLFNKIYLKEPLLGKLTEKVLSSPPSSRSTYPRFTSYFKEYEVEGFYPNIDFNGGFASHIVVPARYLAAVPNAALSDHSLAELSVVADAVSTPYQVIIKSDLQPGDFAIVIGMLAASKGIKLAELIEANDKQ